MTTTAWRFPGTEGADQAVVQLKQLDSQDLINVMDVAVLRWPVRGAAHGADPDGYVRAGAGPAAAGGRPGQAGAGPGTVVGSRCLAPGRVSAY